MPGRKNIVRIAIYEVSALIPHECYISGLDRTVFMDMLSFLISMAIACDCLAIRRESFVSALVAFIIFCIDFALINMRLSFAICMLLNNYVRAVSGVFDPAR